MEVRELMTTDLGYCTPTTPLQQVAEMMIECDCGCLPVVEDTATMRLMGVVTDRDIVCRAVSKGMDPATTMVGHCMTSAPATATPDMTVEDCLELMQELQVRRIPVVMESGAVVGMVSQADIALSMPPPKVAQTVADVSRPYLA